MFNAVDRLSPRAMVRPASSGGVDTVRSSTPPTFPQAMSRGGGGRKTRHLLLLLTNVVANWAVHHEEHRKMLRVVF